MCLGQRILLILQFIRKCWLLLAAKVSKFQPSIFIQQMQWHEDCFGMFCFVTSKFFFCFEIWWLIDWNVRNASRLFSYSSTSVDSSLIVHSLSSFPSQSLESHPSNWRVFHVVSQESGKNVNALSSALANERIPIYFLSTFSTVDLVLIWFMYIECLW